MKKSKNKKLDDLIDRILIGTFFAILFSPFLFLSFCIAFSEPSPNSIAAGIILGVLTYIIPIVILTNARRRK